MNVAQDIEPIEETCGKCPLRQTKPGTEPEELIRWITMALDLDALKEQGASFAYPETLSPREWLVMKALGSARAKEREKESRRRDGEARERSEIARLEALRNRNG